MSRADDIARDLRRSIESGEYPVHAKLPSVESVRITYGVSAVTVRAALRQLRILGWVLIVDGAGTYVREPSLREAIARVDAAAADSSVELDREDLRKVYLHFRSILC